MAVNDKVEKIRKLDKTLKKAPIAEVEELKRLPPNKERFDLLMHQEKPEKIASDQKVDPSKKGSWIAEIGQMSGKTDNARITPTELIAQVELAANKMGEIKAKLQEPGVKVKEAYTPIVQNKLSHINDNIRITLSHAGGEITTPTSEVTTPPVPPISSENPIMRFLGFLTDGEYKLRTLATDVDKWNLNKTDINPATMLAVQIKVNFITQELEFFSSLLNKALESTKTIMNVQV